MRAVRSLAAIVAIWACGRAALLYERGLNVAPDQPERAVASVVDHAATSANLAANAQANPPDGHTGNRTEPFRNAVHSVERSSATSRKLDHLAVAQVEPAFIANEAMADLIDEPLGLLRPIEEQSPAGQLLAKRMNVPLRVSGTVYAHYRNGNGDSSLSGSDRLGGSQAALRLSGPELATWRGWALRPSVRVVGAASFGRLNDVSAGLSVARRSAGFGIELGIERRMRSKRSGHDAFAANVIVSANRAIPNTMMTIEAYGQAGLVGTKSRTAFADGEVRAEGSALHGPIRIYPGIAAWGAIQPSVSRVDLGPSLRVSFAAAGTEVSIRTDWRVRVAGNARPGSGPALTIAADF